MNTLTRIGEQLVICEQEQRTRPPISEEIPTLSVENAYQIQSGYARARERAGARLIGAKIGCTSAAIQQFFGVFEPDFGLLFDDMSRRSGSSVRIATLIQPRIEPEIAVITQTELRGPGLTETDVLAAISSVAASMEIVDSRIDDWRIKVTDTIADNGSSSLFVLGEPVPFEGLRPLHEIEVRFGRDGGEVIRETGAAVMGSPIKSVAWLANTLGSLGQSIPAGSVLLSGSFTTALPCSAGDRYTARFSELGDVSLAFE